MPSHSGAVTGAPDRAYWPLQAFGTAAPGCISQRRFLSSFHRTEALCAGAGAGTCSPPCSSFCSCCDRHYSGVSAGLSSPIPSVRLKSSAADSSSSAPSSMVGVMRAPPVRRASSCLPPLPVQPLPHWVKVRPSRSALLHGEMGVRHGGQLGQMGDAQHLLGAADAAPASPPPSGRPGRRRRCPPRQRPGCPRGPAPPAHSSGPA